MIDNAQRRPMPAPVTTQGNPVSGARHAAREPLAQHLRRIAVAAAMAVSPFVAICLLLGRYRSAFSLIGGAVISLALFAMLRILVYGAIGDRSGAPNPASMALFGIGALGKFLVAVGLVYVLVLLHANLIYLLAGFAVAQIAVAVRIAREMKGRAS